MKATLPLLIASLTLCLFACSSALSQRPVTLSTSVPRPVDLSGSWEVDYARSDNIQQELNTLARQLRQEIERRARAAEKGYSVSGAPIASGRDLLALAEMAELITASELLDITQTEGSLRIKRDNSFALVCRIDRPPPVVSTNPFGQERCGWDAHQLYFDISLPDGLEIRHRVTRAALGNALVVQSAVYSPTVREPFVINKVFTRYDPDKAGFRCTQTLSRGRVCTTEASEQ